MGKYLNIFVICIFTSINAYPISRVEFNCVCIRNYNHIQKLKEFKRIMVCFIITNIMFDSVSSEE
jgi:hypothetical protein